MVVVVVVVADAPGRNVATNGAENDEGRITGIEFKVKLTLEVPNWMATAPVAAMSCAAPAAREPAKMVDPVVTFVACTQDVLVALATIV